MSEIIDIKPFKKSGYVLLINPEKALELGLFKKQMGYVSFGTQRCFVYISASRELEKNEIHLSQSVIDYLHLPAYPDFEIRVNDNGVIIGPHIGIFYQNEDAKIKKADLYSALEYVSQYSELHGSVVLFALDKVDQSKRLIEGYCYNPKSSEWQRGTFPYPLSLYLWISLNNNWRNHFLSAIGNTTFNDHYLNKLLMYKWLATDPKIIKHLPYTALYNSSQDIFNMLERYTKVYVKPIAGLHGKEVVQISLEDNKVAVRYRENGTNLERYFNSIDETREYIEKLIVPGNYPDQYIVQQPVELMTYEGRVIDFRLIMIKDGHGKWICKTIIARVGAAGSVVSNASNGGEPMTAGDLLRKLMGLPDDQAAAMEEQIRSLGFRICDSLDSLGISSGNLGLDIGIDKNDQPWVIEVNSRRPGINIAFRVKGIEFYHEVASAPLFYAKFLAGFKS